LGTPGGGFRPGAAAVHRILAHAGRWIALAPPWRPWPWTSRGFPASASNGSLSTPAAGRRILLCTLLEDIVAAFLFLASRSSTLPDVGLLSGKAHQQCRSTTCTSFAWSRGLLSTLSGLLLPVYISRFFTVEPADVPLAAGGAHLGGVRGGRPLGVPSACRQEQGSVIGLLVPDCFAGFTLRLLSMLLSASDVKQWLYFVYLDDMNVTRGIYCCKLQI